MSKQYDEYLFNHIQAVKACFDLLTNIFDIYDPDMIEHDLSKYTVDEYKAYDNYFYTKPVEEIVKKILEDAEKDISGGIFILSMLGFSKEEAREFLLKCLDTIWKEGDGV